MNIRLRYPLAKRLLSSCALLGVLWWPSAFSQMVQKVYYEPEKGELTLETFDNQSLKPEKIEHNSLTKEFYFYLMDTVLDSEAKTYFLKADPVVKSVKIEPKTIADKSAVRVQVLVKKNVPYVPFAVRTTSQGLKLSFTPEVVKPKKPMASKPVTDNRQKTPKTRVLDPIALELPEAKTKRYAAVTDLQPPQFGEPSGARQKAEQELELVSSVIQEPVRHSGASLQQSAENQALTESSPVKVSEVSGMTASSAVIEDVFYDENSLTVVASRQPIQIARSFLLEGPYRYVVDLSPAVLSSASVKRAILQQHPGIQFFRVAQFDENTVRIVTQYQDEPIPVHTSQWEENRVMKITFR